MSRAVAYTLRECCKRKPIVKQELYRNTTYKLYVIECPVCGIKSFPCRRFDDALKEWNNPQTVTVN